MPPFITDDVDHFLVFRFGGDKRMVGYRQHDKFYVLWFDHNLTLYGSRKLKAFLPFLPYRDSLRIKRRSLNTPWQNTLRQYPEPVNIKIINQLALWRIVFNGRCF